MTLSNYTKEFKYNLSLAAPVMMGMIAHTLVALADNIMVGQLGTAELAAVSLGNSFIFIAMSVGIGFSTAITPLVAEADGEQNFKNGKSYFKHGLWLCSILGVFLFLLVFIAKPLLYYMKQPEEVVILASPYLDIVAFSLIPLIIFQAFKQFSDGLSMTKPPMYATVIANILNVIFNYLLIFGTFGFPKLGIVGAAIGTLIARFLMLLLLWKFMSTHEKSQRYVTHIKIWVLKKSVFYKIIKLGFPSALQMFFEVAIFTAAIWLSGILGKNVQAANQIALNLSSMTFMVFMGLSVASMVRVGNQKGLKAYHELRRIAHSVFILTFVIAIVFALFFVVFHSLLPWLYLDKSNMAEINDIKEVVTMASQLLLVSALFQISDGLQVVALGALRGLQDVKIPTLITFIAYWLVGFPISFYLGLYTSYKSLGIWIGLLAGLSVSAILLIYRFNTLSKMLSK
ncbi:MATE family efflux transporter [Aquimarina sp. ERC-38]|uniref:MATE family efflux transporter n=1 Tax=Aquimarina sp. ERC-38 TaxID=2949996 RepID=UPI002245FA75|nr:MATE family efflux transporter [Aquimarina sp. ERC-38]UZO80864.1 MATE family efflux transporter [Aquimarina sp. ERC-38]